MVMVSVLRAIVDTQPLHRREAVDVLMYAFMLQPAAAVRWALLPSVVAYPCGTFVLLTGEAHLCICSGRVWLLDQRCSQENH